MGGYMIKYILMLTPNGDIEFEHSNCCFPVKFEEKINTLAKEKITKEGTPISFMPGFRNTFCVMKDKWDIFVTKVLPHIGSKLEENNNVVWDKEEETHQI